MNTLLAIIIFLVSMIIPGWMITVFLPKQLQVDVFGRLAWSGLIGSSVVSLIFFTPRLFGQNNLWLYVIVWLCFCLVLSLILFKFGRFKREYLKTKLSFEFKNLLIIERFWLFLVAVLVGLSLLSALNLPVIAYDSLYIWSFTAKNWFFNQCDLQAELLSKGSWHANYPWQMAILQYWLSMIAGRFDNSLINFVAWFYYVIGAGLLFSQIKIFFNKSTSLIWTLFYLSSPLIFAHSYQTYADLPLAVYILAAFILLYNYLNQRIDSWIYWLAILVGFGYFVKLDAMVAIIASLIVLFIMQRRGMVTLKKYGVFLILIFAAALPWLLYIFIKDLSLFNGSGGFFWRPEVILAMIKSLFWFSNWHIISYILFTFLLIYIKLIIANKCLLYSWLYFSLMLFIFLILYLFTSAGVYALNQTATSRNLLLMVPSMIWLATITFNQAKQIYEKT